MRKMLSVTRELKRLVRSAPVVVAIGVIKASATVPKSM
jgi:hypothetical protein